MRFSYRKSLNRWKTWIERNKISSLFSVVLNPCNIRLALCLLFHWMFVRRRRCFVRYICLPSVVFFMFFITYVYHSIESYKCRDEELQTLLQNLCSDFSKGNVVGNLCSSICSAQPDIHYIKCLNYIEGKAIIFASWNSEQIILKTKHSELTERETLGFYAQGSETDLVPDVREFLNMLRSSVETSFGVVPIQEDRKLLSKLWHFDEEYTMDTLLQKGDPNASDRKLQKAIMKSIWSLSQQDEYLFLQYFSENQFLPDMLGSCGHVYAMEYAPSTEVLEPTLFQWSHTHAFTWPERVDIALKLLDVIRSSEADYKEPLHYCDVKGANFGISNKGVVKPIDVDTVFFHSKLLETFQYSVCTSDKDCNFFDCLGICDISTETCLKEIHNNNLQAVCMKIFSGSAENMFRGLLHGPPSLYKAQFENLLTDCRNLTGSNLHKSDRIFENLKSALELSRFI